MLKSSVNLGSANLTCITKAENIFYGVLRVAPRRGLVKALRKGSKNCTHLAKKAGVNMTMVPSLHNTLTWGIFSFDCGLWAQSNIGISLVQAFTLAFVDLLTELQCNQHLENPWPSSQTVKISLGKGWRDKDVAPSDWLGWGVAGLGAASALGSKLASFVSGEALGDRQEK